MATNTNLEAAANANPVSAAEAAAAVAKKIEEYIEKIHYSDRYTDDFYEYRHVILPKPFLKYIPKQYFSPDDAGTLRLLSEPEWRGIGITQSLGWEHYEVHAPEPHVLLFRRSRNFVPPPQPAAVPNSRISSRRFK